MSVPFLRRRAAAVDVLEAAHTSTATFGDWLEGTARALEGLIHAPLGVVIYVLERSGGCYQLWRGADCKTPTFRVPAASGDEIGAGLQRWLQVDQGVLDAFHQGAIVDTRQCVVARFTPEMVDPTATLMAQAGLKDSLGMNAPCGDLVLNASALSPDPIRLSAADKRLLAQVTLHLGAGLALHQGGTNQLAVIDAAGRLLHATGATKERAIAQPLLDHVKRVERSRARRRRGSEESLRSWHALIGGHWGLVERTDTDGKRQYVVLETPASGRQVRTLTPLETKVLRLSARGTPGKLIAYGLGISQGTVSRALQSCAFKVGVRSRTEMARVGAVLLGARAPQTSGSKLTQAEQSVLELVQRGLSNVEIARARGSSPRTVANQVAALLMKLQEPSRRAAAARA